MALSGAQAGWTHLIVAGMNGHAAVEELVFDHGASADLADEVTAPFSLV